MSRPRFVRLQHMFRKSYELLRNYTFTFITRRTLTQYKHFVVFCSFKTWFHFQFHLHFASARYLRLPSHFYASWCYKCAASSTYSIIVLIICFIFRHYECVTFAEKMHIHAGDVFAEVHIYLYILVVGRFRLLSLRKYTKNEFQRALLPSKNPGIDANWLKLDTDTMSRQN